MQTNGAKVVNAKRGLFVNLPLTRPTGKVRVKWRSCFSEYGEPIATRTVPLPPSSYVEWQIGYDLPKSPENAGKTSLRGLTFKNYKGETKFAYELSEIVFYARQHGLIEDTDIAKCIAGIQSVPDANTFEETASVCRTEPEEVNINGLPFNEMQVPYPLYVYRFGQSEIFAEIMIREKQKAVGTQAMLYVCMPITALTFLRSPIGHNLDQNECAEWHIGREEAAISLELFRVFGMLSPKHRHDVLSILKMLFPDVVR